MDSADLHEWVSFDLDGDTYVFDLTFLTSNWACIFGQGCLGILDHPAPELVHGCCTYGAHFTGKKDRKRVQGYADRLTDEQWQHKATAAELGGAITKDEDGNIVSHVVDGACIFLNRIDFAGGPGCALHSAALQADERPLDWKPRCAGRCLCASTITSMTTSTTPTPCESGSAETGARAARSSTGGAWRGPRRSSIGPRSM